MKFTVRELNILEESLIFRLTKLRDAKENNLKYNVWTEDDEKELQEMEDLSRKLFEKRFDLLKEGDSNE